MKLAEDGMFNETIQVFRDPPAFIAADKRSPDAIFRSVWNDEHNEIEEGAAFLQPYFPTLVEPYLAVKLL